MAPRKKKPATSSDLLEKIADELAKILENPNSTDQVRLDAGNAAIKAVELTYHIKGATIQPYYEMGMYG